MSETRHRRTSPNHLLCRWPLARVYFMATRLERHPFSRSAELLTNFLDALPVPVYRTTLEGEIVFCNAALAKCFGYQSPSELIGTQVTRLYQHIKDRGDLIHRIMTSRCLDNYVVALRRKSGRQIWCAVTATVELDDDDMIIHLDGVLRDVTDRVNADIGSISHDAEICESGNDCGKNEKFKGVLEMAGGVAHIFNQPLTIATNLVNELVAEKDTPADQLAKLLKIQHQIVKLNQITRKIANIHKYAAMDYVAGVKIVDIDNASLT